MSRSRLAPLAALLCFASACETPPEDGTQPAGVCESMQCPADSTCTVVDGAAFCDCNDGFVGSGDRSASRCYPATTASGTCRDTADGIACDCNEGFVQERYAVECSPQILTCDDLSCNVNATCQTLSAGARCRCKPGFEGDGTTCVAIEGPVTCDDLTCGDNAICQTLADGAICRCNTGYAGDGYTCTPSGAPCPNGCPDGAVCIGQGVESRCQCDDDHYPNGPILCEPKVTASGACDFDSASNTFVCACNPGYEHLANRVGCSDIDECDIPEDAPGGCKAWCTNLEGSATCTSTVADASSPYWQNSCDPHNVRHQPQTQLAADCRCGENMTPDTNSPMGMCWRPIGAATEMPVPYRYGTGPGLVDVFTRTPETMTMVMHQASRKIYLGIGYTIGGGIGAAYTGAIIEVDADTGNRRIVAGFWPDEFGGTHYPEGLSMEEMTGLTILPEVQNMVIGPDGETLFVWVQDHYSNAQILKVNRITGVMELMWAEHLWIPIEPRHNLPEHGQCWNGERVSGRNFVQINNRGFAMDADGNYLLTVAANSAAGWISPTGIVRISPDGATCEWVRRTGAGPYNAYFDGTPGGRLGTGSDPIDVDCDGTVDTAGGYIALDAKFYAPVAPCGSGLFTGGNKGSGAAAAVGSPFRAIHWVGDKLWAIDNNTYGLWEIDTKHPTGWRVRAIGDNLAEDWIVEDTARDVVWLAGTGSDNNMGAFHFDEVPANRWWSRVSPVCGALPGPFPCLRGPMSTFATHHQPIVLDELTGDLIGQHGPGTVRIEPETGNNLTFSL